MTHAWKQFFAVSVSVLCITGCTLAQNRGDSLKQGFENPPSSARPRVWWHWMNGNITQEGIKLDLEWMHRVGIAGFQNFDAALSTPQVVPKRLPYMTPEWKDAFKYAIGLGDQFGMEMAIAGSPGWSESGGPWVPPDHGMKKYVWSETVVEGGHPFAGRLAQPPGITGPFQNVAVERYFQPTIPQFYADAAVVAFREPEEFAEQNPPQPTITSSGPGLDATMLSDGDLTKTTDVPIPAAGAESWVQFEYSSPQTIRSVTYVTKDLGRLPAAFMGIGVPEKTVEASDDGQTFRKVATLTDAEVPEHTMSFPPVTAKYFRITFKPAAPPPLPLWATGIDPAVFGVNLAQKPTSYKVAELVLHLQPRVNHFEEKAAFVPVPDLYEYATPQFDS